MNWLTQTTPLFPDLEWSKPETTHGAGKLLIIGGQAQEFSKPAEAYMAAEKAGAGVVRVILPESTKRYTAMLPTIEYAPANPSGSFSKQALGTLMDAASWADAVLLAGDLGKNAETNLMLETFLEKYSGLSVLANDIFNDIVPLPTGKSVSICDIPHFQKIATKAGLPQTITTSSTNQHIAETLKLWKQPTCLVTPNGVWTFDGTQLAYSPKITTVNAATVAVWAMQHPGKLFQAITTAVVN